MSWGQQAGDVHQITVLKTQDRSDYALELLKEIHQVSRPVSSLYEARQSEVLAARELASLCYDLRPNLQLEQDATRSKLSADPLFALQLVKPLMKKHGWYLPVLCEFLPSQAELHGVSLLHQEARGDASD